MQNNGALKRTRPTNNELSAQIAVLSALTARLTMAHKLGFSHQGVRDLFKTLGYPEQVKSADLVGQWRRQDIARAIVDRPTKATWQGDIAVNEPGDEDETELEKAYKILDTKINLKNKFMRIDKLAQLGKYAVLLLGFDDSSPETWSLPVTDGARDLLYVRPISEKNAEIHTWESDPANERYGKPRIYKISLKKPGTEEESVELSVHWTRVIHVAQELLEDDVEGVPIMESLFNRLKDLEKLVGGSAEMFWRGARPGYAGSAKENYKIDEETKKKFKKQIEEYENDLRRILMSEGIDLKSLDQQISDPKGNVEVQLMMIAAATGIPLRILTGSERGQLASTQDQENWKEYIQARRQEIAEPTILRPFIDEMIKREVLPKPQNEEAGYSIDWPDLSSLNDKDRSEIGKALADALAAYAREPMTEHHVPLEAFLIHFLNMEEDTVTNILKMRDAYLADLVDEEDDLENEREDAAREQELEITESETEA